MLRYSRCIALDFQPLHQVGLTDRGRPSTKTRMNRLIDITYFPVRSIKKKGRHGKCIVKVLSEKYSVRYMNKIRKLQYEYADFHID